MAFMNVSTFVVITNCCEERMGDWTVMMTKEGNIMIMAVGLIKQIKAALFIRTQDMETC